MNSKNSSIIIILMVAIVAIVGIIVIIAPNNLRSYDSAGNAYLGAEDPVTMSEEIPDNSAKVLHETNDIESFYVFNQESGSKKIPLDNLGGPQITIGDKKGNKAIFQAAVNKDNPSKTVYSFGDQKFDKKLTNAGIETGIVQLRVTGFENECDYCFKYIWVFAYDNDLYLGQFEYQGADKNPVLNLPIEGTDLRIIYYSYTYGFEGLEHIVASTHKINDSPLEINENNMSRIFTNMLNTASSLGMEELYNFKIYLYSYNDGYTGIDWTAEPNSGSLGNFDVYYYSDPQLNGYLSTMFMSHTYKQPNIHPFYANMITSQKTLDLTANLPVNSIYDMDDFSAHIVKWDKTYFRIQNTGTYYANYGISNYDCTDFTGGMSVCFSGFWAYSVSYNSIPLSLSKTLYIYNPEASIANVNIYSEVGHMWDSFVYDLYQGKLFELNHPRFETTIKLFDGYNKTIDIEFGYQSPLIYSALIPSSAWAGGSSGVIPEYSNVSVLQPNGQISNSNGMIHVQCSNLQNSNPHIGVCVPGIYRFTWTLRGIYDGFTISKNFCYYNGKFTTNIALCNRRIEKTVHAID